MSLDRPMMLSVALIVLVFAFDLALPLGVAAAVPYTFAVLLGLQSKVRRFATFVALVCCVLTIAKLGVVTERGSTELWKVVANRCLAVFAIGMTTFLGLLRRKAETERAQAEEKVREHLADLARMGRLNMAGQLAAGVAHELNQPLAAVCLQAEMAERMAEGGSSPRELAPVLREIAEQSQRAAEIVRGLRRMIRREDPAPVAVDLNEVVRGVVKLLDTHVRRAGAEMRLELAPLPAIPGDRVQLEQVVFNLLQNAVESVAAVQDGPRIVTVISAIEEHDRASIIVRDTGPGFAAGEADRLFERFHTTKPNGMGMGLAISRSIIEAHGGRIWAARLPDGGATFAFSIPRS